VEWVDEDQQQKRDRHGVDQPDERGRDLRGAFRDAVVAVLPGPAPISIRRACIFSSGGLASSVGFAGTTRITAFIRTVNAFSVGGSLRRSPRLGHSEFTTRRA